VETAVFGTTGAEVILTSPPGSLAAGQPIRVPGNDAGGVEAAVR